MPQNRRAFIKSATAIGAMGSVTLAGCTGSSESGATGSQQNNTGNSSTKEAVGKEREITLAHYFGKSHPFRASLDPWKKRVENRTNISINEVGGGSLGGPAQMMSLVQTRTAEVATVAPADYGSKLALSNALNLPATYDSRLKAADRVWKLARGILYEEEWSNLGLEPLATQAMGPYQLESANGKMTQLSDWNGRSVRSPGGIMSTTIQELGGTPVEIAHSQADAFQRGVINTNIHTPPASVANSLVQFLDAATRNINLGSFSQFWVMNQNFFNELEPKVQKTLLEIGKELTEVTPKKEMAMVQAALEKYKNKNVELYDIPSKNKQKWQKTLIPVKKKFLSNMNKQGHPGDKVLKIWDPKYPYRQN
jgi:TRAP-type C4-dicarboxylate transport system substrate-binding protein